MPHTLDSSAAPSAYLDANRSRANTGASLSAASYGTSSCSAAASSVVSNGSLVDLYAHSPGSIPDSSDTTARTDAVFPASTAAKSSSPIQLSASTTCSNGIPMTPTARGFQAPNRDKLILSIPPSESNASIWTTASAPTDDSPDHSKRASMAGFDIDVMRSVQPAHDTNTVELTTAGLPLSPRIGIDAPQNDSDGSHYDDDEMSGAFSHNSTIDRSADRTIELPLQHDATTEAEREGIFTNALPSPPVPRRTSSVMQDVPNISPSPSLTEGLHHTDPQHARHAASRSGSGQLRSGQIPQRHSSADFRDEPFRRHASNEPYQPSREPSPSRTTVTDTDTDTDTAASRAPVSSTKGTTLHAVHEGSRMSLKNGSTSSHEPSPDEQKRLEQQLLAEADESRPRTLKEARERAKMRRQQSETVTPPSTSANSAATAAKTTSPRKGASLHIRDVASSATAAAADDNASRSSIDSRDRPLRNPKRISNRDSALSADRRSLSERSAPSDYSHDSDAEGAFTFDQPAVQPGKHAFEEPGLNQPAASMDDLANAVNDAMNSLSFGSADETLSADDDFATPLPPPPQADQRPRMPTSLPSAHSLASVTGTHQEQAQAVARPSPLTSPAKQAPQANFLPAFHSAQSLSTLPLGSPVQQRTVLPPAQIQRSLPARIDVYGQTLSLPKAFASGGIIVDKKRASSWERARTYAQYTNELLHLETGLNLWMEVVQRPAMRQQSIRAAQGEQDDWLTQGTLPRSTHVRNEGSYAESVRSDMTFPMRGDGAKAKELVSVMPTMNESPVGNPVNLPYPGAVSQPRSNSTQSFSSISSSAFPLSNSTAESLAGAGSSLRSSGIGGGNRLFGGLGRKGSKRATPSATVSNNAASSPLSSIAVAVGGSRAYLANNRNKRTASPGLTNAVSGGSMTLARPSTDIFESTCSSSHSRPESPATAPVHVTGLGLGAKSGDAAHAPPASAFVGRLDTVREARAISSPNNMPLSAPVASTSGTTGLRAPLGPRAPNTGANGEMKRTSSNQSQNNRPITPNTPITPISGGFGSGATFVSRLGGGSFSSSSAHMPRSPTVAVAARDGYSSAEFLTAPDRRMSDLIGTSPTSPSLSASHDASAGLGTGLRSSLSYGSVRDRMRRGSIPGLHHEAFNDVLIKLGDILPDADEMTLRYYLKKAKGDDLTAIGDYLQDQSLGKLPKF
ncbi:uncharacterized protein MEPE_00363 [Melanopsichium pennsylvanicum]|uniref:Uncharacterized protein n=2 Tax=Melanopsichium pennsylvanicum TaxID=63383 RepID=A0AAJ5C2L1_9BASI|nr:hypothetical protein BN887_00120 [Melanopsichium pennsylvanicum 4]SNX81658.1 uncharacterized protein MEPE_00363 [Melanopsichium pennsylvanicum]